MKRKQLTAAMLAVVLGAGALTGCGGSNNKDGKDNVNTGDSGTDKVQDGGAQAGEATYTYNMAFNDTTVTWNTHESVVTEYITGYTEIPLWDLILNDTADGYKWICEMAAAEPEDITPQYAGDEKWGVPADATEGYAWRVTLNPDAKWEDGTPINADSYIYSMQQVLNPEMKNYRASDFYSTFPIYNAENYAKSGEGAVKTIVVDAETYEVAEYGDAALYVSFTQPTSAYYGYSAADYYSGYEAYYVNEAGEDLLAKYGSEDYVPATDEVIADINYMLMLWYGESEVNPDAYLDMAFYDKEIKAVAFDEVGFFKSGDYELTVILYIPQTPYFFKYNAGTFALVNEEKYEAGKQQTGDMVKTNYGTSVDSYMSFGPYKLVSFQPDKEWRAVRNENWYGWTDGRHEGQYQTTDIVCTIVGETATQEQLFLQGKSDSFTLNAANFEKYQGSDYIVSYPSSSFWLLNINNDEEALKAREEAGINKTILTYEDFRHGISLATDPAEYVSLLGYGTPTYGIISSYYVYDVENGIKYRESEPAQRVLKEFYGVDDIDQITGYDLDKARSLMVSAYEQALADGAVKETDKFVFDYPTWDNGEDATKEVNFLQNSLDRAVQGTALEGRITVNMVVSEDYYNMLDSGEYDICLSGWNGAASDPYAKMQCFVTDEMSPQAYLGFDPEMETLDITLNGTVETHTYYDWYQLLCNGEYAIADADTRNEILASMELGLMLKYRDCPFYEVSTSSLLSKKIAYPTYEPVFEVSLGGIRFMTYNYTDAEWEQYCKDNNYQLNYK